MLFQATLNIAGMWESSIKINAVSGIISEQRRKSHLSLSFIHFGKKKSP